MKAPKKVITLNKVITFFLPVMPVTSHTEIISG